MRPGSVNRAVGAAFLAYGVIKTVAVLSLLFLVPLRLQKALAKVPALDIVVTGDASVAGHVMEYILLVFSVYSIVHGLALLDALPGALGAVVHSLAFQYGVYIVLGVATVAVYALVLWTRAPIPSDPEHRPHYEVNVVMGAAFLLVPIVWHLALPAVLHRNARLDTAWSSAAVLAIVVALAAGVAFERRRAAQNVRRPR